MSGCQRPGVGQGLTTKEQHEGNSGDGGTFREQCYGAYVTFVTTHNTALPKGWVLWYVNLKTKHHNHSEMVNDSTSKLPVYWQLSSSPTVDDAEQAQRNEVL